MTVVRTTLDPMLVVQPPVVECFTAAVLPDHDEDDPVAGWTFDPHLNCELLSRGLSQVSQASFARNFGRMSSRLSLGYEQVPPLAEAGLFVLVRWRPFDPNFLAEPSEQPWRTWVGYFVHMSTARGGTKTVAEGGDGAVKVGTQTLRAVGLEWFLDRVPVRDAVLLKTPYDGTDPDSVEFVRLEHQLGFNEPAKGRKASQANDRGNRSRGTAPSVPGTRPPLAFYNSAIPQDQYADGTEFLASPALWDGAQIVEYLLAHHAPSSPNRLLSDTEDEEEPRWDERFPRPCKFRLATGRPALEALFPRVPLAGQTVLGVIRQIANPRRGMGVIFEYNAAEKTLELNAVSMFATETTLPGAGTIPANVNPIELVFDDDPLVTSCTVAQPFARSYTRLRAVGAKQTQTLSMSAHAAEFPDLATSKVHKCWTQEEEDAYNAATDEERRSDKYAHVYTSFRIAPDWNGESIEPALPNRFPKFDDDGQDVGPLPVYAGHLDVLHRTAFPAAGDDGLSSEFQPPRAYLELTPSRYTFADDPTDAGGAAIPVRCSLHKLDHGVGFRLQPSGPPHSIAAGTFTGTSEVEATLDYRKFSATFCVECGVYAEGVDTTTPADGFPEEEIVLEAGEGYRLDSIYPLTRRGIKASGEDDAFPDESNELGVFQNLIVRDDRPALRYLASLARRYYQTTPKELRVGWRRVHDLVLLGDLVTTIGEELGEESIDSVVAEVTFDFREQRTTIATLGESPQPELLT